MRVRDEQGTNHKWAYGRSLETAQTIGEQFKPFPYSERLRPQLRERARWFPTDVFRGRPCLRKRRQHRAALPPERTFHKNDGAAREARDFCDGCYFQFVFVAYFLINNLNVSYFDAAGEPKWCLRAGADLLGSDRYRHLMCTSDSIPA